MAMMENSMSLDEEFMHNETDKQNLLDDQCDLESCKKMYRNKEIDLIEYMDKTTQTPEYKRLKEKFNEKFN